MLSITGMTLEQFVGLMAGIGYKGEKAERVKVKAAAVPVPVVAAPTEAVSLNPVPEEVSLINIAPEPEATEEPVPEAAPEMEAYYTFTWAPKPRERPERPARPPRPEGTVRPERGPRSDRGPRRDTPPPAAPLVEGEASAVVDAAPQPERPARERRPDRPKDGEGRREGYQGKPREGRPKEGGKPAGRPYEGSNPRQDGKPGDRPPRKDDGKSKAFEARPPRVEKPIDPDNPFAVLAALRLKS
jgi:ATP-dependent RNA helicase SUPV3L1/SUV3